jgi:CheY-like chemotaxis protein
MINQDFSDRKKTEWLNGLTLLVAEDDPTNYRLLVAMLKSSGARMQWARDGREAIEYVRNKPADERCIVLMDIKMPVVDGYEAKNQIKLIDDTIPVIAVTAYAQSQDREKIMNNNFDGYISKPIDVRELLKVLSEHT